MDSSTSPAITRSPQIPFLQRVLNCSSLNRLCWHLLRGHPAVAWWRSTSGFHTKEIKAVARDGSFSSNNLKDRSKSPLATLMRSNIKQTCQASFLSSTKSTFLITHTILPNYTGVPTEHLTWILGTPRSPVRTIMLIPANRLQITSVPS